MKTLARIGDGHRPAGPRTPNSELQERVQLIDIYELPQADLTQYHGLLVGTNIDQEFLYKHREIIATFLDQRKVVVFGGHLSRPWLPGCGEFVPRQIDSFRDYILTIEEPVHPVFEGVDAKDITFSRGVAGFFARGHNVPQNPVRVVVTLPGGEPVVYEDRTSTRGAILVQSGNDMSGSGRDSSASRIAPQLLDWIEATYAELQVVTGSPVGI